jgi:hypothetical protein
VRGHSALGSQPRIDRVPQLLLEADQLAEERSQICHFPSLCQPIGLRDRTPTMVTEGSEQF